MKKKREVSKGRLDQLAYAILNHGVKHVENHFGLSGISEELEPHLRKGISSYVPSRIDNPALDVLVNIWGKQVFK